MSSPEQEVLYGGAGGGGKSYAMVADPFRYVNNPNFRGLLVRRTNDELRELISTSKRLYMGADKRNQFLEREKTWVFPSGATLWMSYLESDDDVLRYQGQAFSWIGFDELTQWNSPYAWNYMRSRLRTTTNSGLRLYQRATTNPGNVGHCVPFGEVLTTEGWKDIRDMAKGDWVYSLSSDRSIVIKEVSDTVKEFYRGCMVSRKDQMVFTENHRLPMVKADGVVEIRPYYDLPGQVNIARAGTYSTQKMQGNFVVPDFKARKTKLQQPGEITWQQYAKLLGWFLSEGHTLDRDKEFGISQTKVPQRSEIKSLLIECGFKFREAATSFTVSSPSWWNYFQQFGKCRDKFIPQEVFDSGYLKEFFECLMAGDGHWVSDTSGTYYTISKRLADDVSKICILLGYSVQLISRQRLNREGLSYEVRFDSRSQTELNTGNHIYGVSTINKSLNVVKSDFEGFVYCITVPETETFFIRQNGYVWVSGNTWVKKMFVDPAPPNTPFWATDIDTGKVLQWPKGHSREGEPLFKRKFIPATLFDNPYLAEDGYYEANLLSLPDHQKRQLLYGDWDINEGSAFPEFNREVHVVEPFVIPNSWPKFRAADYGYGSFTGVLWFAVAPNEQLIVYRELLVSKVTAWDLADLILETEAEDRIKYGVLDSSLWHNRGDRGPSLAEQMISKGCRWRPSDRSRGSRVAGKNEIHRRLQIDQFTEEPGLVIFNNCVNLINQLPSLPLDKTNPEDVDTKSEDHLYDALRYGIMSRPRSGMFDSDASRSRTFEPACAKFGY